MPKKPKLKITTHKLIEVGDWDHFVTETYKRPYSFQQQDGCQDRGIVEFKVPDEDDEAEFFQETIPEEVNGDEMGVTLDSWLARSPKKSVGGSRKKWEIELFWHRNFYPSLQAVANDLHAKGLLPKGKYKIRIDW